MGVGMTGYKILSGTGKAVNGGANENATVIAAQGAGTVIRVMKIFIAVPLAAVGGSGHWAIEDGVNGTQFLEGDANAVGVYAFDFGDEGYPLTANTLLNITTENAVTTQASVRATAIAKT